ncbi:MAG: von Willebrand domain-containing protein [Benniella sp.]|nr:MAG: von Willebrand domain-containing protein [Benniella sp.]
MTSQLYGLRTTDSQRQSLPLVNVEAHTVILETISRTTLTQTYLNPSASDPIPELMYAFPLYDGVSVVGFTCRIGDRTIVGQVKERQRAKKDFKDAVLRGDKAALLEQLPSASDVFTTTVGNIPAGAKVVVEITYIGELKHDAEVNGVRFTIPTSIMPRYGNHPVELSTQSASGGRLQVTVDVVLAQSNVIQKVQSPSHPITVSLGTTSFAPNADAALSKASATLCLGDAALDKDFIIQVVSKDTGMPTAILETHPTIPNQRALMATLVPKFALPAEKPEVVFICDCSGSMEGSNINLVRSALKVFLKSLPVGIKFNICYFGSKYSFLWSKSATYSQATLDKAIKHAERISANMGGTEMFQPIKATLDQRYKDIPLAVMLLTDGEIWNQESLFTYLNKEIIEPKAPIRVFTLGIGNGVSHALIEGVAKAGNGFSQSVGEGEKMEGKVVRMLKAALTPHVSDYTLEVKYTSSEVKNKDKDMDMDDDDDFEVVEKVVDGLNVKVDAVDGAKTESKSASTEMKPISLFDPSIDPDSDVTSPEDIDTDEARFAGLPMVTPKLLQTPHIIPPLYAFNRTNVYLLMSQQSSSLTPKSVVLRGVSRHGPLEIEIPIQILDTPGETIHQLGAKSAIAELEQGRGWITQLKDESDGQLLRQKYESRFSDMVEREAVRLGVQFQVGGKWCSFVATETRKERDDDATLNEIGVGVEDRDKETREIVIVKETEKSDGSGFAGSSLLRRASSAINRGYTLGSPPPPPCAAPMSSLSSRPSPPMMKLHRAGSISKCHKSDHGFDTFGSSESDDEADAMECYVVERAVASGKGSSRLSRVLSSAKGVFSSASLGTGSLRASSAAKKSKVAPPLRSSPSPSGAFGYAAPGGSAAGTVAQGAESTVHGIVGLQTFEGYWKWQEGLLSCVGVDSALAAEAVKKHGWDLRVAATALAIVFLEKKKAGEKDAWELVVEKAKGWMEEQIGANEVVVVLHKASELVQ